MDVFQSAAPVDYFEYFSKQFPEIVLNMARLRDELALRQGAINAVQDTLRDREDARFILANAKKEAEALLEQANKDSAQAKRKSTEATNLAKTYKTQIADFSQQAEAQLAQLGAEKSLLQSRSDALDARERAVQEQEAAVLQAQSDLDRRIKEFQSRVASIAGLTG